MSKVQELVEKTLYGEDNKGEYRTVDKDGKVLGTFNDMRTAKSHSKTNIDVHEIHGYKFVLDDRGEVMTSRHDRNGRTLDM